MKTLILGMGNTILCDDAIGIIVKRYLEKNLNLPPEVEFSETSWGGFRIIDLIRGYDYVIVIDSIKTGREDPGFIHHLKTTDLLPTLRLNSYHDINFITAIKLARAYNEKMPSDIDIFAVEVENNYTIKENLSPEIKDSIYNCSCLVMNILKDKEVIDGKFDINMIQKIETEEDLLSLYKEPETHKEAVL